VARLKPFNLTVDAATSTVAEFLKIKAARAASSRYAADVTSG
jgi:hypothetical protein